MNRLFSLLAAFGLAISMIGCADTAPAPKPVTPPADAAKLDNTPAPADPAPPVEEKK